MIARLDLITAKARYSRDFDMYPPDVNTEGRLWLRNARHPLLEHLFRNEPNQPATESPDSATRQAPLANHQTVRWSPIDVRLGIGFNLLVITGPNTGGKTVTLKTTGLLCLMAQCGMHIPAGEGSLVPVFRHILADIGDEQSLEQSLSTFSSHISRIASIFEVADADSLVLLDELGAGHRPDRRGGARPGDPRSTRRGRLPGDRDDAPRRPEDLRLQQRPGRERGGRVRRRDAAADVPAAHRPVRHEQRAQDRPPAEAAEGTAEAGPQVPEAAEGEDRRTGPASGTPQEAEKAKVEALAARHEADREKEEFERQARRARPRGGREGRAQRAAREPEARRGGEGVAVRLDRARS